VGEESIVKSNASVFSRFCEIICNLDIYLLQFLFVVLPLTLSFALTVYAAVQAYKTRSG
jgi:hypothetical protein